MAYDKCRNCGQFRGRSHTCPSPQMQSDASRPNAPTRSRRPVASRVSEGQREISRTTSLPLTMETLGPVYEQTRAKWPLTRFGFGLNENTNGDRWVCLTMLEVAPEDRGKGIGSEVMEHLTALADRNRWTISLDPSSSVDGYDKGRLTVWYQKFGFVPNEGRNAIDMCFDDLVRRPR